MATRRKRGRDVAAAGAGADTNNIINKNKNIGGIEENTMAMLDSSGFGSSLSSHDNHYLVDDRLAFLEAVRSASLIPDNGTAPTNKMYEAIFKILKDENSMDLIVASYQLLNELEQCFPRVYLSKVEKSESSSNSFNVVVVEEAWSPFTFGMDAGSAEEEANKDSGGLIDPLGFHTLIEEVSRVAQESSEVLGTKSLRDMLLLQYLVKVIEQDLLPRSRAFIENMNWELLRESLLNLLLGSRKIIYKSLMKDYLCVMCEISHGQTESLLDSRTAGSSSTELCKYSDNDVALAFPEVERSTCAALKKLLVMIMELDSFRNVADQQGLTSRADGVRTHVADIILDVLTYNEDLLGPFFQVFDEKDLKLKLILQYFQKYMPKSSVRTRKSNGSADNATFDGILKYLSNSTSARNIIKKIGSDVVQLLLAHAFQANLSLSLQQSAEGISCAKEDGKDGSLVEICKNTISAFTCLSKENRGAELLHLSKEALFSAVTTISSLQ